MLTKMKLSTDVITKFIYSLISGRFVASSNPKITIAKILYLIIMQNYSDIELFYHSPTLN